MALHENSESVESRRRRDGMGALGAAAFRLQEQTAAPRAEPRLDRDTRRERPRGLAKLVVDITLHFVRAISDERGD